MKDKPKKLGNITLIRNVYKNERYASKDQPEYVGKITIEQEEFECSLWVNNHVHSVPLHMSGQITIKPEKVTSKVKEEQP